MRGGGEAKCSIGLAEPALWLRPGGLAGTLEPSPFLRTLGRDRGLQRWARELPAPTWWKGLREGGRDFASLTQGHNPPAPSPTWSFLLPAITRGCLPRGPKGGTDLNVNPSSALLAR